MKSVPDYKSISPKQFNITISKKNNGYGYGLFFYVPRIKTHIPLFVLFRALGIISDKEICNYIIHDLEDKQYSDMFQFLQASIIDSNTPLRG